MPTTETGEARLDTPFELKVLKIESLTPRVKRLVLQCANAGAIPSYTPGSHLELHVPHPAGGPTMHRAYSLVRPHSGGDVLEIAVQREETGSGGSRWVHQLTEGAVVQVTPPRNHFPMHGDEGKPLLLAAGIGITPILCMALDLQARGLEHEFHYVARTQDQAAYAAEVIAIPGSKCWFDNGDPSKGIPLAEVIGGPREGRHLHVCGPKPFITAVLDTAKGLGWPESHLHCELFTGTLATQGDAAFTVELKASAKTLSVPADKTIMEVMEEAGLDPIFDCRRGDCGICVAKVLEGEADHRDICLSKREHDAGNFCICVSRAKGQKLVLNL